MRVSLRVVVTARARAEIDDASAWWSANRPAASYSIHDELDRVLDLLVVLPSIGAAARSQLLPGVRRIEMPRIGYFLYYRIAGERLEVLALWHAKRGRDPNPR